jgi:anaerobic dimethyl sulfoxide reductase subunit B (iron-sulfur subunit)
MAKQYAFYFNAGQCINCKACQSACDDKNDLPAGTIWRHVWQYSGGGWVEQDNVLVPNLVYSYSVSTACMHCLKPICLDVCPTEAIYKRDDGIVLIDDQRCIGCRYCQWACPYAAPAFREDLGVMTKCTFCEDLLAQGENPACVDACVMRCLDYGELEELRARYGDLAEMAPLPTADITDPAFVLTPSRNAQPITGGSGRIINLPEEY